MYVQHKVINFFRLSLDNIILITCFTIVTVVLTGIMPNEIQSNHYLLLFVLMIVWFFSTNSTKLYADYRTRNFSVELIALFKNVFVQLIASIVILYFLNEEYLSKTFAFAYTGVFFLVTGVQKYLLRKGLFSLRKKGKYIRNLLIIGAGDLGKNFYDVLKSNHQFGYNIVGFLDDQKYEYLNGQYLGVIKDLEKVLSKSRIDNVVIALPNYAVDKIEEITRVCDQFTTRVMIIPDYVRFVSNRYKVSMFGRFPVINVREERLHEVHWIIVKRIFDFALSLIATVFILSWLIPFTAIAIKLSSRGPVFFKQERWGKNNRKFTVYKFRSMVVTSSDTNEKGSYQQAKKHDPRITKVGKFIRKTNIDEIPQIFNVLKGEMSIVGPRPHPTPLNLETKDKIGLYMVRHLVKPGLTGWAQVNGYRGETSTEDLMKKRVGYDLWYIENWSFWLDIQIVFLTAWRMIAGDPNAY